MNAMDAADVPARIRRAEDVINVYRSSGATGPLSYADDSLPELLKAVGSYMHTPGYNLVNGLRGILAVGILHVLAGDAVTGAAVLESIGPGNDVYNFALPDTNGGRAMYALVHYNAAVARLLAYNQIDDARLAANNAAEAATLFVSVGMRGWSAYSRIIEAAATRIYIGHDEAAVMAADAVLMALNTGLTRRRHTYELGDLLTREGRMTDRIMPSVIDLITYEEISMPNN